jgi:hypothetical protein
MVRTLMQAGFLVVMVVVMLAGSASTAAQPHASEQVVFSGIGTFTSSLHATESLGFWIWC